MTRIGPPLTRLMKLPSSRWTRNCQPQRDSLEAPKTSTLIFPVSQSPLTLVHADELISNGFLVPLFVKPLKMEASDASDSDRTTPISSHAQKNARTNRCSSLRRCRRLSKQIFQKYLDFLRPLCVKNYEAKRSGSRHEADSRIQEVNKWIYSPATSPRTSVTYSVDNWRRSCDSDSSIYEAVLHCKKSIDGRPFKFWNLGRGRR
ncbi:hypothetical protein Acr_02g0001120 [Actinidia rufa]|uniref:Membrane-associated kinase regulator 6 n=1 Tax=Actinidia rufa TaxID=165716 RepID=A0A7J0E6H1_9ERIC|nr:hypothetical protein Acr_02g0001120 [Actinidia rufa]